MKFPIILAIGGTLLALMKATQPSFGFVFGAGSEGVGYNFFTILCYGFALWSYCSLFVTWRRGKSEEKTEK